MIGNGIQKGSLVIAYNTIGKYLRDRTGLSKILPYNSNYRT